MADEKEIGFKININGVERSITNLKQYKAAVKEAQEAAVLGNEKAAKTYAELRDKINEVNDTAVTFTGSGLERATAGFSLLTEGISNLDFGKVTTALKGLRAALASTGILLLVQGITYLIENFKELSEGTGVVGKALRFIGDIIGWVIDKFTELTDWIGLTNSELDKMGEAIKTNADKSTEALGRQTAAFDRQMKVAAAAGKSTVALEKAKLNAIIETNKKIVEQTIAYVRAGGVLNDEQKKLLTASLENIKNAKTDEQVVEIKSNQEKLKIASDYQKQLRDLRIQNIMDSYKKEIELENARFSDAVKAAKGNKKIIEELNKQHYNNLADIENKYIDEREKAEADRKAKQKAEQEKEDAEFQKMFDEEVAKNIKQSEEDYAKRKAQREQDAANRLQIEQQSLEASKALTDLFFQLQLNNAKGNEKRELEIRKRMFQVDKAFNVSRTIQDGIRSVQAALTIPPPAGQILAGINAGLAAANVAKILATRFDAGGGAGGGGDIGGGISGINTQAPVVPTPTNTSALVNQETGKIEPPKAYVVETEISEKQKKVNTIIEQNTF